MVPTRLGPRCAVLARMNPDANNASAKARSRRPPDAPSSLSRSITSIASVTAIEVFADIWCPFAHLGLRTVIQQRSTLGRDDVLLRVHAWPLELINHGPLDPSMTANHVDELRSQVAPDLFAGFDERRFPRTTLPALALAAAAHRTDARTGEAVSLALRDALFERGYDISDPQVLTGIATAHGLPAPGPGDERQVLTDWKDGQSRGVKGSPHFFCGQVESFCPALSMARDESGHLHIHRDAEALDRFLAECLTG